MTTGKPIKEKIQEMTKPQYANRRIIRFIGMPVTDNDWMDQKKLANLVFNKEYKDEIFNYAEILNMSISHIFNNFNYRIGLCDYDNW